MKAAQAKQQEPAAKIEAITITPPNFQTIKLAVKGSAPLLQLRFGAKAELLAKHQEGGPARSKRNRVAKDLPALFKNALHVSTEGWYGIPCAAFRNAAISACRVVGYKMTLAKMAIFVEADGYGQE
ncbi:MAG TPA: hypothetical protein VMU47_11080, partial [Caldimonas sp.]|nr:hypothetical protein [Caldimonas sp.]